MYTDIYTILLEDKEYKNLTLKYLYRYLYNITVIFKKLAAN